MMQDRRTSEPAVLPSIPAHGAISDLGRLIIGLGLLAIASLVDLYRPFNRTWSILYILVGLYAALRLRRSAETLLYGGVIVSSLLVPMLFRPETIWSELVLYHRGTSLAIGIAVIAMFRSRRVAFDTVQQANANLEHEVNTRTSELQAINQSLQREIVERRRAEFELQSARDRMRKTIETVPIVICTFATHPDGRISMPFFSPQIRDLFGLSPDDLADDFKLALNRIPDQDRERVIATAIQASASMTLWRCEYRIENPERGTIWVDGRSIPSPQPDGTVHWHGYLADITDRKQMEASVNESMQRLQISEQRFRSLADAIPQMVWIANREGKVVHVNATAAEYSGLSVQQFLGSKCEEIAHPDEGTKTVERWAETLRAGTDYYNEVRFRRADGAYRWHIVRALPIRDSAGEIIEWYGTATDIEELKQSKQDVIESEERYRRLVEFMPYAVFISVSDKIVFCNSACLHLFGACRSDQILGKDPFELIHPDSRGKLRQRIATLFTTGEPVAGDRKRMIRLDGRDFPVYIAATPITDQGADGVLFCLNDLTDRERASEVLHSVLGSVEDAILNIDEHGTIQLANPATERLFGYSWEEVIGQNVKMLMPEPYYGQHDGYLDNYLRTGISRMIGSGREVSGRRKDGTTFPLELTVTEFRLNGKHHFTGVVRDITARKRLENQFQQSQKMEAVGRLAGGVAHDFNNLLTVINGYSDLILSELPVRSSQRESVRAILDAGERATRLTQQLLAFSRKAIVEPKILDLNEVVEQTANMLRRLIEEDITLTLSYDPNLPRIKAAQGQLEQILVNTVVNARDAMPEGGKLMIETRRVTLKKEDAVNFPDVSPGIYAELALTDTGCGMPREVTEKIFEPFFTTKELGKGTGLGLSVVHGIVKQCGGTVFVESAVNVGTSFKFLFPVAAETGDGLSSDSLRPAFHGDETVMLVEDEDAVRTIVRFALQSKGYTVLEASGGPEAIRMAEEFVGTIDLLVTDVVIPEMGGPKIAEALRRMRPGIRVMFISGYTDDAVLQRGVTDANEILLQKPFTAVTLARKVRAVLDDGNGVGNSKSIRQ